MAVGCGWQAYVAYVNIGCYYVVGIPLGLLLGFYFDLGVKVPFINIYNELLFFLINTTPGMTITQISSSNVSYREYGQE